MPDAPNASPAAARDPKRRKLDDEGDILKINDYTIDFSKKLGAGTYGEVYKATGPARYGSSRANYAVKIAQDTERNRNEAKLLKNLKHVNVVELVESIAVKKLGAKLLLVMPQAAGTLADVLKNNKPGILRSSDIFSTYDRWECANQLLVAVDYLHNKQPCVIHRDLKPANILLFKFRNSARDEPFGFENIFFVWKVADFGLGKELAERGSVAAVHTVGAGTPKYMAPEVAAGGPYSKAADLYSLGEILRDLLEQVDGNGLVWEFFTDSDPQFRDFDEVVSGLDDISRAVGKVNIGETVSVFLPRFVQQAHPEVVGAWLRCRVFLRGFFWWGGSLDVIPLMMSRRELVPFITDVFADGKFCADEDLLGRMTSAEAVVILKAACAVGFSSGAERVLRCCLGKVTVAEDQDLFPKFLQIFLDRFGMHATDAVLRSLDLRTRSLEEYCHGPENDFRVDVVRKFRAEKLGDLAPMEVP